MDSKTVFVFINPVMKWLLQSPLHRIYSHNVVVVEFKGRKSGNIMTTPVSYHIVKDKLYFFTFRKGIWWKNIAQNDEFILILRRKRIKCTATIHYDGFASQLKAFMTAVPREAKMSQVKVNKGQFDERDVAAAVDRLVCAEVQLPER